MAGILSVLLATTVLLGWFGLGNFAHALTFPGRLTGAVLITVAFTTLLAAGAVLDHWVGHSFQYSGLVALIGVFAALLTNTLLLLRSPRTGDLLVFPALFGALSAGAAWSLFTVWRTSVTIPAPKRVAAAVIVSSALTVTNFGYQNLYLPYRREARPVRTWGSVCSAPRSMPWGNRCGCSHQGREVEIESPRPNRFDTLEEGMISKPERRDSDATARRTLPHSA
ncbi:hypothetical protein [Streptomyces sp. 900105755]